MHSQQQNKKNRTPQFLGEFDFRILLPSMSETAISSQRVSIASSITLSHLQSLSSHQTLVCIVAYDTSRDAESCSKQSLARLRSSSCESCVSHAQRRKREHASTSTFLPGLPQSFSNIPCISKGHWLGPMRLWACASGYSYSLRGRCMESALLTGRCSKSINRFSASFLGRFRAIPSRTVTCCSRLW